MTEEEQRGTESGIISESQICRNSRQDSLLFTITHSFICSIVWFLSHSLWLTVFMSVYFACVLHCVPVLHILSFFSFVSYFLCTVQIIIAQHVVYNQSVEELKSRPK